MYNLPLHSFNEASLIRLGSILGTVLSIHPSTVYLTQQKYAKVCVQLDVSKRFVEKLWIGTSKEYGWEISLEYEGNNGYCEYCGLLGHTLGLCRKKRDAYGKAVVNEGNGHIPNTNSQRQGKPGAREQWVAKTKEAEITSINDSQQKVQEDKVISNLGTPRVTNLQKPQNGDTRITRQALIDASLIEDDSSQGQTYSTHGKSTMGESQEKHNEIYSQNKEDNRGQGPESSTSRHNAPERSGRPDNVNISDTRIH